MKVAVIGTGYVGLVTGACFANLGHDVTCIDVDPNRIRLLEAGHMPFYEPGMEELVRGEYATGNLRFTLVHADALPQAQVIFICVGTPSLPEGRADLRYVESAARSIAQHLSRHEPTVIVNKSTVPVGTGDWVESIILDAYPGEGAPWFDVVSNPEFLREGSAIHDAFHPDRIVVGVDPGPDGDLQHAEIMAQLYAPLLERNRAEGRTVPYVQMDRVSAEMVKYAANAFLAAKISFINEIAGLCARVGADVKHISHGIGLDKRIGQAFLNAGIGWGGSCFPKDTQSLVSMAQEYGYEMPMMAAVQEVNTRQKRLVAQKLLAKLKRLKGKTICILGLAFKPGTDDLRSSPALDIAAVLHEYGARVKAYDPQVKDPARVPEYVELAPDAYSAVESAHAVVLATEWPEFKKLDWTHVSVKMGGSRKRVILDGRNFLDGEVLRQYHFDYVGIGR